METENYVIEFEDYLNYWMSLFPEVKERNKLEKILEDVSNSNFNSLEKELDIEIDKGLVEEIFSVSDSKYLKEIYGEIEAPFSKFYFPIINYHFVKIYNFLIEEDIIENLKFYTIDLLEKLISSLSIMSYRTLIFEVNYHRESGQLKGENSEERFNYFENILMDDKNFLKNIYDEYYVLTKLMFVRTNKYFDFIIDILKKVKKDSEILSKELNGGNSIGKVKKVLTDMGDTHKGGKTVVVLEFSSGVKVVYKPHSLGLEMGFFKFIQWINDNNIEKMLDFKNIFIYSGEDYGWMEFVEYKPCNSVLEVKNYYKRIGHFLAVLFLLNGKDFHHENIIANGEYPVLIDLESIFHAYLQIYNKYISSSTLIAHEMLGDSVYSIGLLPQRITKTVGNEEVSVEISGTGAEEDQISPFQSYVVKNNFKDDIRLEKEFGRILAQKNTTKINEDVQKSDDYVNDIKEGFVIITNWIINNKEIIINKIKEIFVGKESRYIIRPTYVYSQLLRTSFHPDFLREDIHRKILLHRIGINADKRIKRLVVSEYEDMLLGDIPLFNTRVDENSIIDSRGKSIENFFMRTPMEIVIDKIIKLDNKELERQLYYIDISFFAKNSNARKDITDLKFSNSVNIKTLKTEEWLKLADNIGSYINEKSITGKLDNNKIDRTWISTILEGKEEAIWGLAPVGNDLYLGNCGIALFLGNLGKITGKEEYIISAKEAMNSPIDELESLDEDSEYLIGAFNGMSGYLYTLANLSKVIKDENYIELVMKYTNILEKMISKDRVYDIIGGVAGNLSALISIYNIVDNDLYKKIILDVCKKSFNHLKENAKWLDSDTVVWPSINDVPLTGFAHGSAGIATSMAKLYKITNDNEILKYIKATLNFERKLYSEKDSNWYCSGEKNKQSFAWCNGSSGILLSRTIIKDSGYIDEFIDKEIEISMNTTITRGFGHNPSLCHGDLGNLAIVDYYGKIIQNQEIRNRSINSFQELFDQVLKKRWNNGIFRGTESISLMVGLAGVGYSLLNNYTNNDIPQVLWLE